MTINDEIIQNNTLVNLTFGNSYFISCIAKDSRPSVNIDINLYNENEFLNLKSINNDSSSIIEQKTDCDSNFICTTIIIYKIILDKNEYKIYNRISCNSINNTDPYNLTTITYYDLNIQDPTNIIDFTNALFVSQFFDLSIYLDCTNITDGVEILWVYSPNGIDLFQIKYDSFKYTLFNKNGLTISNLDFNDDGYYACGYSPNQISFVSFTNYKLFVKGNLVFKYTNLNKY
jgi:hypothetical protein